MRDAVGAGLSRERTAVDPQGIVSRVPDRLTGLASHCRARAVPGAGHSRAAWRAISAGGAAGPARQSRNSGAVHLERTLTTNPYYRSTYAFVSRQDRGLNVTSFEDPILARLRIAKQFEQRCA